ncbi:hypothetical protein E9536_13300 [Burkholderia sp. LS-044]|nr:hypothetical protein E9536_13300 [Burkholderia sp. LS-044]
MDMAARTEWGGAARGARVGCAGARGAGQGCRSYRSGVNPAGRAADRQSRQSRQTGKPANRQTGRPPPVIARASPRQSTSSPVGS